MNEKVEITHIEIRRVQNGFVIFGLNMNLREAYYGAGPSEPLRVSFVAKDADDLANVIKSLCDDTQFVFRASCDIPVALVHRDLPSGPSQQ